MIDLIYNFIWDVLLQNSTLVGAQDLAVLLTYTVIILIVFVLIRLTIWCFNLGRTGKWRR